MTSHYQSNKDANILVIGGGDGGIARDLRKKEFNSITIVEIDERITILSKTFFPRIWDNVDKDRKCNFIYTDAIEFVKQETFYDYCIIDLTDPDENSRDLYTKEFFSAIKTNSLSIQLGIPGMQDVDLIIKMLEDCLYDVKRETICVPSFFGGPWVIAHCKR